jgi:hypothetical protein
VVFAKTYFTFLPSRASNRQINSEYFFFTVKLFEYLLRWRFPKVVPMGAIVIRTRYDEGTESGTAVSCSPVIRVLLYYCMYVSRGG